MVKGNHALPYTRKFRKWWQRFVKIRFNAPLKKAQRRVDRQKAIAENGPRPIGMLRPIVHRPTYRYNMKIKFGRGFTLEELKKVGVSKKVARTVGISVDHRRRNKSVESLELNAQRLNEYISKLVVFPKHSKAKNGLGGIPKDTPRSEMDKVKSVRIAAAMPLNKGSSVMEIRTPTEAEKVLLAYKTLRQARWEQRSIGKKAPEDNTI